MKRLNILIAIAVAIFLGAAFSYQQTIAQQKESPTAKSIEQGMDVYSCPMHPDVTSDKPGKCHKCGMSLEKKTIVKPEKEDQAIYYCPMHPEVTSTKPGKCPKCGMNLEKKETTGSKVKTDMEVDSMCAEMCAMMMNDPAMMKMMHECMMGGMGDMKDMNDKPNDAMRMKAMEKMKSCCGMMKNK